MKLRSVLLAATVLAVPVAVKAQPVTGLYIGAGAGGNILQDRNLKSIIGPSGGVLPVGTDNNGKLKFTAGFVGVGSVGYGFGNGLRVELEGSYRSNKLQKVTAFNSQLNGGGNEQKYGAMVNVLYDFPVLPWMMPYIGAGVGYQWAHWQNISIYNNNNTLNINSNATEGGFAYQAIAGIGFPIEAVPGLALTLEYRFMGLTGGQGYTGTASAGGITNAVTIKAGTDYNQSLLLGVRYNFGVAPPPPPPVVAPAPAPARSYLVFFDWDKYNLTDRAKQIIADAAANIGKVQHTRIEVNGYTDTSGTPKYNMGLSIRRAQAVAAELVKDGVKKEDIAIQGFGDTRLLVPTGPGVREPQNRRVEIIIK